MSVNSKMTAIANQIRTLVGATGTMGLDAMATNLTNANGAMSGIRTQLANKGVTMPTSADILDIATYIGQIESAKVVTGTISCGGGSLISLTHGLGRVPQGFILSLDPTQSFYLEPDRVVQAVYIPVLAGFYTHMLLNYISCDENGNMLYRYGWHDESLVAVNETKIEINVSGFSGVSRFQYASYLYAVWG